MLSFSVLYRNRGADTLIRAKILCRGRELNRMIRIYLQRTPLLRDDSDPYDSEYNQDVVQMKSGSMTIKKTESLWEIPFSVTRCLHSVQRHREPPLCMWDSTQAP